MTEQEWLDCALPNRMLEFLRGKPSDRKLRLFAVACCRRIWDLLSDDRWRATVETVERHADGLADLEEFTRVVEIAMAASWDADMAYVDGTSEGLRAAQMQEAEEVSVESMIAAVVVPDAEQSAFAATLAAWGGKQTLIQAALLRDIFGNPFRPVTVDPEWLIPTVTFLARMIYEERSFDQMPELADSLEAAGCTNEDILAHCRDGSHVRGCWVVDMLMGKD